MKKSLLFISALFVGLSAFNQNMARYAAVNERAQSMIELNRIEAPPTNTAVLPAFTEHIGILRGLIQSKTTLGEWKAHLLKDPTQAMEA
ncbi:MAG: hypothetical protein WCR72_16765, partial [Bacteroidota bacterium]